MKNIVKIFLVAISLGSIIGGYYLFVHDQFRPKYTLNISAPNAQNDHQIITWERKINTKEGYSKSLATLSNEKNAKLKKISVAHVPDDWIGQWNNNVVQYLFATDNAPQGVIFDYQTKKTYVGEIDISNAADNEKISLHNDYPGLPITMVDFGVEGALRLLQKSSDYKLYKEKNPEIFEYYIIETQYNKNTGWQWFVLFFSPEKYQDGNYKKIAYVINANKKTVEVKLKDGLTE